MRFHHLIRLKIIIVAFLPIYYPGWSLLATFDLTQPLTSSPRLRRVSPSLIKHYRRHVEANPWLRLFLLWEGCSVFIRPLQISILPLNNNGATTSLITRCVSSSWIRTCFLVARCRYSLINSVLLSIHSVPQAQAPVLTTPACGLNPAGILGTRLNTIFARLASFTNSEFLVGDTELDITKGSVR